MTGYALRLDVLKAQAEGMHDFTTQPIAEQPRIHTLGDSLRLQEIAGRFPIDDVVQFAAERHGRDPSELSAMGIRFSSARPNSSFPSYMPKPVGGTIYYPFMNIVIPDKRGISKLNADLRKMVRYFFQPSKEAMHENGMFTSVVRLLGVLSLAGNMGSGQPVTEAVLKGAGVAAALFPGMMLELLSPQQWDADIFALRNRSFRPFTKKIVVPSTETRSLLE